MNGLYSSCRSLGVFQSVVRSDFEENIITACDHSLHKGHLVLFQGFSLEGEYMYMYIHVHTYIRYNHVHDIHIYIICMYMSLLESVTNVHVIYT